MKSFSPKSAVMQLTEHLREEILSGGLGMRMPGVNQLVRELGLGTQTVIAAIAELENEGLLENLGGCRGRRIVRLQEDAAVHGLKVGILLYEGSDASIGYLVELRHRLQEAGHTASFGSRSLIDLRMDPERVARYVKKNEADAWVVFAGSRPVLEWFASQPFPCFAMFGRSVNVNIAGLTISKVDAISEILRRLVGSGHRRIVLMAREERRKPEPGLSERHFIEELEALGVPVGAYNLPDWDNDPKSFQARLGQLFAHSPPSAMFFGEPMLYFGAQAFFNRHRIQIPDDLSVFVLDNHPAFEWCDPMPTHLDTDPAQAMKKVMMWIRRTSGGEENRRKTVITADIVEGGTIGIAR